MNDVSDIAVLDRLCGLLGIETRYLDVWKRPHDAPHGTKVALLRAMGVDVGDGARAAAALAEAEDRRWRDALPAATVVREGESPLRVTLVLGPDADPAKIDWVLELEQGERMTGVLRAGALREVEGREIGGARHVRCVLELPIAPQAGYHWFSLREPGAGQRVLASTRLIACPARCFQPAGFEGGGRVWGPALQVYALRSKRGWGVGDYGDLAAAIEAVAALGAGIVGVNPLHALFPTHPEDASPYSPSSRLALNVLYIDVEAVPELAESEEERARIADPAFQARLRELREKPLVDYAGVARVKLEVLERLHRRFRETGAGDCGRAFRAFQAEGGERLRLHALFDALQEHFVAGDARVRGWQDWPEAYRDPQSPEVERFAREHAGRVEYWQWLQWQARTQVAAAQRRARDLGMSVGLYLDLAVGAHPAGAETWIQRGLYATQASVGAPPDEFNLKGQDWGLPPVIPQRLAQARYEGYTALLRANMRNAGALRIDHVMALMRLFWVPPQASPKDGTYVDYPFADLLGILALESVRNRCIVVGEDLGTVPEEVFSALREHGILSYRPIYFEREGDGGFKPPEGYPAQALVTVSTHDLPTLRGFWTAADLETRRRLHLFPDEEVRVRQVNDRREDRGRLVRALERAGLASGTADREDIDEAFMVAVHAYLARTPAKLFTFQLEDVFGEVEQVNLPGTTEDRHPNWRRKLPVGVEDWAADARVRAVAEAIRGERGPAQPRGQPARVAPPAAELAIPRATYRLQFNKDFTFADATRIVPYLAALGVSHVYASPWLKARPGSTHGYDIIDHNSFNPEIGTAEDFEAFARALAAHGMKQLLDIVPNHMGVMGADNAWWLDVLENGPASLHAGYFDIDWEPALPELRGKVLLPVLGSQYGAALESGEIRLEFDAQAGEFSVRYFTHRFPVDPRDYPRVLGRGTERLAARLGDASPALAEYQSLVTALGHLPARDETAPDKKTERARDKEVRKRHLARLCADSPEVARFVEENVTAFQGTKGRPETFDAMHSMLEAQAFRLAHWRVAADDINYRRFFDINDLAALRMESEAVFEDTHRLVLRLLGEGKIDALRIDHPDGLYDPRGYFERLQERARALRPAAGASDPQHRAVYVTVEKILAEHERLPEDWPVHGTTGYRFMNVLNGLFVDPSAEPRIDRIYSAFIGRRIDFGEVLHQSKIQIMMASLSSELNVLANALSRIAKADRRSRDFTLGALRRALVEIVACFPVYRTYLSGGRVREEDRRFIEWAVAAARKRFHALETSVFEFIEGVFTGKTVSESARHLAERFVARFQQFTSPVMAKGVEDTSFYVYNRLASLNEVGGHPLTFGFTLSAFHGASQDRARTWPHTMLASSTHDNKRSEDVRVRIDVISEIPPAWRLALRRWSALNRRKKKKVGGEMAPSRNDEYLLYQVLLGAWPLEPMDAPALDVFRQRIERYMLKAAREAKAHTSWMNPNEAYEQALAGFIGAILKSFDKNPFLADFVPSQAVIARYGLLNGVSQTLVKLTSPGVPDIYQGNELWDLSLVDPDNRRPVDYELRERTLKRLQSDFSGAESRWPELARELLDRAADGRIKLYLTWRALALRARDPRLFEKGSYLPLHATGKHADCVCAYARVHEGRAVVTIAPRFYYRLTGGEAVPPLGESIWGDTRVPLPEKISRHRDELTGMRVGAEDAHGKRSIRLAELLTTLPVALLRSE